MTNNSPLLLADAWYLPQAPRVFTWDDCIKKINGAEVATLQCFPIIFQRFVIGALILAGIAATIMIILAGYKYITSGGDPKQAEAAQKTLTYAIIGLVVILLSGFIVSVVSFVSGVPCIQLAGFSNCE